MLYITGRVQRLDWEKVKLVRSESPWYVQYLLLAHYNKKTELDILSFYLFTNEKPRL